MEVEAPMMLLECCRFLSELPKRQKLAVHSFTAGLICSNVAVLSLYSSSPKVLEGQLEGVTEKDIGETEKYDEEIKSTLMVGEKCGKGNDKYWITPELNLAPSCVSPAETAKSRVGGNDRRKEVKEHEW